MDALGDNFGNCRGPQELRLAVTEAVRSRPVLYNKAALPRNKKERDGDKAKAWKAVAKTVALRGKDAVLGQIWAYSKDAFLREHKKVTNGGKTSLKYYEQMKWYLPYSKAGGPLSQPDGQQEARSDDDDDDDTAADAPMAPPAIGSDKQPTASGSQQQQMELVYEYPVPPTNVDAALLEVVEKLKTTLETVETPNVAWGRTVGKRMDALSLKRHHQLETQIMQLVQQAEREELAEKERNRAAEVDEDMHDRQLEIDV